MLRALPLAFLALAAPIARADCDLSTDGGIDAAYKAATGHDMDKEHRCARPSTTYPGLVWVGHFAHDRGCIGEGVLVGCTLSPAGYAAAAMKTAGWQTAGILKRLELANDWLHELDDQNFLFSAPKPFGGKTFSTPTATPSGQTTIFEGWVQDPAGMVAVNHYRKVHVEFAADGTHGEIKTVDRVEIPIH